MIMGFPGRCKRLATALALMAGLWPAIAAADVADPAAAASDEEVAR